MLAYIPVNIANLLASFGTIVILTRLLNSEEFGRYAIVVVTMQFTHMGVFTWLEAAMARFQARAEQEKDVRTHLKTIYSYAFALGAAGFALIITTLWALPIAPDMQILLVVAMSSTVLQIFFNLGMEAHKASHRIKRYSATYSTQILLSLTIGILLILLTPLREVAPFIGIIVALIVVLAFDLPFMLKQLKGGEVQPKRAKNYFNYGMPICISLLLASALNSADMYIIRWMMNDAAVGQYNAGYNLANRSIEMIFIWLSMAVTPIAVTLLEKQGLEQSKSVMRDYGASLLWIALPAATGIALVSKEFGFILGESVRAEAVTIMPIIAFAGVMNGLISYYAQRAFMLSGKTSMFMWAMTPPVVLNIALNFWLIPKFGLMGAVYATIVSYTLGFILTMIVGRRYYPLPVPVRAFCEISLCCIGMAAVVRLIQLPSATPDFIALILKASVGGIVYISLSLAMNAAKSRTLISKLIADRKLKTVTV